MNELDTIILAHDIKEYNLKKGDVGTIVHVYKRSLKASPKGKLSGSAYKDGEAFEVEFVTVKGKTVALLTLKYSDIRKVTKNEILHAREVSSAFSV